MSSAVLQEDAMPLPMQTPGAFNIDMESMVQAMWRGCAPVNG